MQIVFSKFRQYRTKKIVGWGDNGETVKYLEYKSNVFSTEGEGCKSSLDEKITVINPPIAVSSNRINSKVIKWLN